MKQAVRNAVRRMGLDVVRYDPAHTAWPADAAADERAILQRVAAFTMTSSARQMALIQATRHVASTGIEGAFVECGVWRGGSAMVVALTLLQHGVTDRDIYLYDTFEGMTAPQTVDRRPGGGSAQALLDRDPSRRSEVWAVAGIDDVRRNLLGTGYPEARLHFVAGPVEATLPQEAPQASIALLRLDTDWYASTWHELVHLYPRMAPGAPLIIDDYGDWEGARKAVDEYFALLLTPTPFMHRIDETGRLLFKPHGAALRTAVTT